MLRPVHGILLCLGGLIALGLGLAVAFCLSPNVLVIQPPDGGWQRITVDGNVVTAATPNGEVTLVPSNGTRTVSPLVYGYHTITVRFTDGTGIAVSLFHDNTGVDRHVALAFARGPDSSVVHVREVINWQETIFSGDVRATRRPTLPVTEIETP